VSVWAWQSLSAGAASLLANRAFVMEQQSAHGFGFGTDSQKNLSVSRVNLRSWSE